MNQLIKTTPPSKKKLVLTVTNDLVTDNRVHKIATTLCEMGFEVTLVGRLLQNSQPVSHRRYSTRRISLWFNQGPLFYANYNLRICLYLLFKNFDIVVSNDLDSLLAGFVATEITRKVLVYDSHEYFTEVPELIDRPWIKKRWEELEASIVPRLKNCYTVCQSIANIYNTKYGTNFKVVRNLPSKKTYPEIQTDYQPPFPTDLPVILYQGAVNKGRGIEEAILAMKLITNARLVIIGEGDLYTYCRQLTSNENLAEKVIFTGRIPFTELQKMTRFATIGLSIEKDMGLNYRFALPNKLFDYIQSEVPILSTQLPEIKKVVDDYQIGVTIAEPSPNLIAEAVLYMLHSPEKRAEWKQQCKIARKELCWENEERVLHDIYHKLM